MKKMGGRKIKDASGHCLAPSSAELLRLGDICSNWSKLQTVSIFHHSRFVSEYFLLRNQKCDTHSKMESARLVIAPVTIIFTHYPHKHTPSAVSLGTVSPFLDIKRAFPLDFRKVSRGRLIQLCVCSDWNKVNCRWHFHALGKLSGAHCQ